MPNILYYGQLEFGHMNVGITLFNLFKKRYGDEYKMYFIVDEHWRKFLNEIDPKIETLIIEEEVAENQENSSEDAFELLANSFFSCKSLQEQSDNIIPTINEFFINSSRYFRMIQPQVEKFFKQINFQLIIVDSVLPVPFLLNKSLPYVSIVSMSCTGVGGYEIPPSCSIYTYADKHLWQKRNQDLVEGLEKFVKMHNKYFEEEGVDLRLKSGTFTFASPDLNIYLVPEEISYINNDKRDEIEKPTPSVKFDHTWLRIDSTIDNSTTIEPYELPKEFLDLPGKIIYFSLGSNFCKNTVLMQKILDVLGSMSHKFIVSTGPNGDKLNLPKNCVGRNWLPQKSVLKVCDMIVTHAGNNTLTESFHMGVPMLAVPLYVDQLNNAARLEELGYGYKVDIFDFDAQKLKEGILKVLNDKELKKKMIIASKRIQRNNGLEIACDRLVEMIKDAEKKGRKKVIN